MCEESYVYIVVAHRFKTVSDFGYVALDILYTYPEDNGHYQCVATNRHGQDSVRFDIACRSKISVIEETQLPEGMDSVLQIARMEESARRFVSAQLLEY